MRLELYLFFEAISMILLFITIFMNRNDTGRRITWIIPLMATVLFGLLMFTPITNTGYIEITNRHNVSDTLDYDYDIISSGSYQDTLMVNFIFFLMSALMTIYSMFMNTVEELMEKVQEVTR